MFVSTAVCLALLCLCFQLIQFQHVRLAVESEFYCFSKPRLRQDVGLQNDSNRPHWKT